MKILVIADNHHDWETVEKIIANEKFDFSVHLGDAEVPESQVKQYFDKYVAGNHDEFVTTEDFFEVEGVKFAILHGHTQGISTFSPNSPAARFGKTMNADVVLHGHTHIPSDEVFEGIRVICPGSIANPRNHLGSTYMVLTINEDKSIVADLKQI